MAKGVEQVRDLEDPLGEVLEEKTLASGLRLEKVRVPLGVVAVVYEARPNVTIDCSALTIKSGNALVLRGSSYAERTNSALADVVREALDGADLPEDAVVLATGGGREALAATIDGGDLRRLPPSASHVRHRAPVRSPPVRPRARKPVPRRPPPGSGP